MKAIDRARKALADDDELAALDAALEAWRETRSAELGAAIVELGARLDKHLPDIGGKRDEQHAAWMAIAKARRAVDWPQLLRTILLDAADRFGTATVANLIARGKVIADWPADPRTTAIVIDQLKRPGYESSSKSTQPFWSGLLALLVAHGDARDGEKLAAIDVRRGFRSYSDRSQSAKWFTEQVAATVEKLAPKPPRLLPQAVGAAARDFAKAVAKRKTVSAAQIAKLARAPIAAPPPPPPKPKRKTSSGSPVDHLAAAERALGDDDAVLEALLDAWRASRAPAIAELVEQVSVRTSARLPAIDGKDRKAIHAAWLAIAKQRRAVDLPRLLASVTHTLGRSTDAAERVAALDGWPLDPRVTTGVAGVLAHPAFYTSSTKPFWSALIMFAASNADPRLDPIFTALRDRFDEILANKYADTSAMFRWFYRALGDAIAVVEPAAPLDSAATKLVERIGKQLRGAEAAKRALFIEIAERPDNDQLKTVLADLLQQHNDPRGELIALQLAGKDPDRALTLIAQHMTAWLGPLAPFAALKTVKFEKGFVSELAISTRPKELGSLVGDPIWATVKSLHLAAVDDLPVELLRHAVMRLEHLGGLDETMLAQLLAWPVIPYRSLSVMLFDEIDTAAITRAHKALANLRVLELHTGERDFGWLWRSPIGKRLERLDVVDSADAVDAYLPHLDDLGRCRLRLCDRASGWIDVRRDGERLITEHHSH